MGVDNQRHDPAALPPAKDTSTHFAEGWVALESGLEGYGKLLRHQGSETWTVQPAASRFTDWAIPAAPVTLLGGLI